MMKHTYIIKVFMVIAAIVMAAGCTPSWEEDLMLRGGSAGNNPGNRTETSENRKVLLLYSAGNNSLREYLLDDIKDLKEGWLPTRHRNDDVLLVYTHTPVSRGNYTTPSTPYLIRLYTDENGAAAADTLITYDAGTVSSSASQLNEVLSRIKATFPARSYGMIFSSHATGYLPAGYYSDPNSYTFIKSAPMSAGAPGTPSPVPYIEPEQDPSLPMVKSIGQDVINKYSYEIDIRHFAEAIPMKLEYILFDACLMGGAEVAYELRGKCGKVGFSQAEVLAEGLDYKTLTKHLLQNETSDPKAVCQDYFVQYDIQSGVYRSATISLIDCDRMESLARVCKELFAAHRDGLANITPGKVQRFYRQSRHWFYDLESILVQAGITDTELKSLHNALDECVAYKGHTPEFMSEFKIDTFSGLSMYLPCNGGGELDLYYRTLKWNEATELVEY